MSATPNATRIKVAVLNRFPGAVFGVYNCRHISSNPLKPWSQHAASEPAKGYYGNALDITHRDHGYSSSPLHQAWLRGVAAYLEASNLNVRQVLSPGDRGHDNHVHVDAWPKMRDNFWYQPPCKGGSLVVVYADGTTGRTFDTPTPPPPPDEEEDIQFIIEALQAQTTAWYQALQDQTGTPGGNPEYWGSDGMAGDPSDQEWEDAAPVLFSAALQAGVMHPASPGAPSVPHSHPIPPGNTGPNP